MAASRGEGRERGFMRIAAGARAQYIQAQLGHASIQITMDVGGHLFPGLFARLVDALDGPSSATLAQPLPAFWQESADDARTSAAAAQYL